MEIPKKIKRDRSITVRLKQTSYERLCELAKKNKTSRADVVEYLIEKTNKKSTLKKK